MIEEQAVVLSNAKHGYVNVKIHRQSACQSCQLKSGCGQSALTKLSSNKCIEFSVLNTIKAKPGDVVFLAISEQGLLSASLLMFMMPLLVMLGVSVFTSSILAWSDGFVALSGLISLLLGFVYARYYAQNHLDDDRFKPEMVRVDVLPQS
ncbi:MAG: sigma-E factor negative regulatory protein RseC [Oleiphilaceae bacterium]|jgi:sigma-E factor negative regulatory protein RseC